MDISHCCARAGINVLLHRKVHYAGISETHTHTKNVQYLVPWLYTFNFSDCPPLKKKCNDFQDIIITAPLRSSSNYSIKVLLCHCFLCTMTELKELLRARYGNPTESNILIVFE